MFLFAVWWWSGCPTDIRCIPYQLNDPHRKIELPDFLSVNVLWLINTRWVLLYQHTLWLFNCIHELTVVTYIWQLLFHSWWKVIFLKVLQTHLPPAQASSRSLVLDVGEDRLVLTARPSLFHLDIFHPFLVDQEASVAQFNSSTKVQKTYMDF